MTDRDPLRRHLDQLPRDIAPRRDLWPGIASRLDQPDQETSTWRRRLGLGPVTAVSLVAAASLAVALIAGLERQPLSPAMGTVDVASMSEDYALVRADLLLALDQRCDHAQAACDGLRSGLIELDRSATDLQQALRDAPAGSQDARRLAARYQRTLEQARGLAGHAARL